MIRLGLAAALIVAACGDRPNMTSDQETTAVDQASTADTVPSSTGSSTIVDGSSGVGDSTSVATADPSTTVSTVGEAMVLALAEITVPSGARVEEFVYDAQGIAPASPTVGRTIVVAIRDVSHPERDQEALCPGDHPLDGCATVDYGAFGTAHDNHVVVDGATGPIEIHLHKSREALPTAEPLLPDE